jgi:hypothetical protein
MKSREKKKIESLARQYRKRGYRVFAELEGYAVPGPIGGFVPDLIAQSADETIIIEVITALEDRERKSAVEKFARIANENPNTRFDLVVVNPPYAKRVSPAAVLRETRNRVIRDLEVVGEQFPQLFFVVLATAIEQLLINAGARKGIVIDQNVPLPAFARTLAESRVISQTVVEYVSWVWDRRNHAVHGKLPPINREAAKEHLQKFIELARDYEHPTESRHLK